MNQFVGILLKQDGLKFSTEHIEALKDCNLIHRQSPTDYGVYYQDPHIALSFQNSSQNGKYHEKQPFHFDGERYWLVLNGEIYNVASLRTHLQSKGYYFHTNSQQELIAASFLDKGVHAFKEFRGIFAILIWDTKEKKLYGARDAFGIKPFYYTENEHEIIFASEKKCISMLNKQYKL